METKFTIKVVLLLSLVLLLHTMVSGYLMLNSTILRVYDEAGYIGFGLGVRDMIAQGNILKGAFWKDPLPRKVFAVIEGVVLTCLDKIGWGKVDLMILFSNLVCLALLMLSTYKIGAILYSREAGLLAAVLLSFSPAIFSQTRSNMLEFPLAAMVSLSLWSLLKTDNLRSLGFSVLTAIFFLLAQFTKEIAVVFVAMPFLYYSFKSLRVREASWLRRINFVIIVLFSLVPTLAFFLRKNNQVLTQQLLSKAWVLKVQSLEFFYYLEHFPRFYVGGLLFIVLVPLMLYYLVNIKKRNLFLELWLLVPLVAFSFSPNRVSRFLLPSLAAFFLLLSQELFASLFHVRKIYAGILVAVAAFQFTIFTFYPRFPFLARPELDWGFFSLRHDPDVDSVKKAAEIFETQRPNAVYRTDCRRRVLFLFNLGWHSSLRYELQVGHLPFSPICPQEADHADAPAPGTVNWQWYVLTADYVVDKTGDLGERGAYEDITGKLVAALRNNASRFKKIGEFKTWDGETVFIYKNTVPGDPCG